MSDNCLPTASCLILLFIYLFIYLCSALQHKIQPQFDDKVVDSYCIPISIQLSQKITEHLAPIKALSLRYFICLFKRDSAPAQRDTVYILMLSVTPNFVHQTCVSLSFSLSHYAVSLLEATVARSRLLLLFFSCSSTSDQHTRRQRRKTEILGCQLLFPRPGKPGSWQPGWRGQCH